MASSIEKVNGNSESNHEETSKNEPKDFEKLRSLGLEYTPKINKSPQVKKQPDKLCNCPQKCDDKIPDSVKRLLFHEFFKLGDQTKQNNFLQNYIEVRAIRKRQWEDEEEQQNNISNGNRSQRRATCKYLVPLKIPNGENNMKVDTQSKGKRKADEISGNKSDQNSDDSLVTTEVCQKAFMNLYGISEKRVRLQREKLITQCIGDINSFDQNSINGSDLISELGPLLINKQILDNFSNFDGNKIPQDIPTKILLGIDNDMAIVSNFFGNQLWKPEYIGCAKKKLNKNSPVVPSK